MSTVEEIRITDLDMQKRWTTTDSVIEDKAKTTADETQVSYINDWFACVQTYNKRLYVKSTQI